MLVFPSWTKVPSICQNVNVIILSLIKSTNLNQNKAIITKK